MWCGGSKWGERERHFQKSDGGYEGFESEFSGARTREVDDDCKEAADKGETRTH